MLRPFFDVLRSWWTSDRIRVSPREGRLLSLPPGSALLLRGQPAVVRERRAGATGVLYICDTASGSCKLHVRQKGTVCWLTDGSVELLTEDDVETYPQRTMNPRHV